MSRTRIPKNYPWAIGTSTTKGTRIFGQRNLALYPGKQNNITVVTDICPHRGAKLSTGVRVNGCIVCPYHGYMFDEHGDVVKVNYTSDCKLKTHDVTELYDLVWISSSKYCPPICPELNNDKWMRHEGSIEVKGNWIDWIANLTDYNGTIKEYENRIICENINGICEFIFPNTIIFKTNDSINYQTITPVSKNKTRLTWCYAHTEDYDPNDNIRKQLREKEQIICNIPDNFPLLVNVPVDEYQLKIINKLNESVVDNESNTFLLI